jgi:hypothetical protein
MLSFGLGVLAIKIAMLTQAARRLCQRRPFVRQRCSAGKAVMLLGLTYSVPGEPSKTANTTHFGYKEVPVEAKESLVGEVGTELTYLTIGFSFCCFSV